MTENGETISEVSTIVLVTYSPKAVTKNKKMKFVTK
jgi:hypothetical protein